MLLVPTRIARSPIHGIGLFVTKDIPVGCDAAIQAECAALEKENVALRAALAACHRPTEPEPDPPDDAGEEYPHFVGTEPHQRQYREQLPAEATLDHIAATLRSHASSQSMRVDAATSAIEDYFTWKARQTPAVSATEGKTAARISQRVEPHDCRSTDGETVGLIDAAIITLRLASRHNLDGDAVTAAIADLVADREIARILDLLRPPDAAAEVAREMLEAITRGAVRSVGTLHNTYCPQIDRALVERWTARVEQQQAK